MKNINNTWYVICITKLLTLYEFSMHIHNIYNIMWHIQYTYDIEVWFQAQRHETSLRQGQKTNALGKMFFNTFIKIQHFLIYGKISQQRMGLNTNAKAECRILHFSESSLTENRLFSALYFSWALFIIHLFWADCSWNPLSSTHLWHKPVKMCRFITQRSKPAAANNAESALTAALQRRLFIRPLLSLLHA